MTPVLQGRRIRLEPLTRDHFPALLQVAFDERLWRYMITPVRTRDDLEIWMEDALRLMEAGTSQVWVSRETASGRLVGSTRFADLDLRHKTAELGYTWLTAEVQGTGLNTEAKYLQLRFGFEDLGLNRIAFKIHHANERSQAAVRKLGATYEGTFRNHYVMPDGSLRHSAWFSIIRQEWPAIKQRFKAQLQDQSGISVPASETGHGI